MSMLAHMNVPEDTFVKTRVVKTTLFVLYKVSDTYIPFEEF